ncbi:MAG: hypothetical protein LBJ10_05830 [Clostridiales bacterium]|jgi:uncharacterized protein YacL|nr:hypothetical protein [Clostridiales bacterium]
MEADVNLTLKVLLSATGAFTGFTTARFVLMRALARAEGSLFFLACCVAGAALAGVFFASGGYIIHSVGAAYDKAEKLVRSLTIFEVGIACAGLVVGLAISFFITLPLSKLSWVGLMLTICVNFLFGYIGLAIALWKCRDITGSLQRGGAGAGAAFSGIAEDSAPGTEPGAGREAGAAAAAGACPKLLDTSAIIDGRIADIIKTGFLEGPLVVPEFVLAELRHIADSADALKRGRGRRGLDVLRAIQGENGQKLSIVKYALPEGAEVDAELVSVAQRNGYTVLTTDYNLNKVASVQGVRVLNINELNNAIKPMAVPGEVMDAQIVKEGKEPGQGVAYMPDGSMIVVEGARSRVGETLPVVLTSVLQTAAGRMIFAKPKAANGNGNGNGNSHGHGNIAADGGVNGGGSGGINGNVNVNATANGNGGSGSANAVANGGNGGNGSSVAASGNGARANGDGGHGSNGYGNNGNGNGGNGYGNNGYGSNGNDIAASANNGYGSGNDSGGNRIGVAASGGSGGSGNGERGNRDGAGGNSAEANARSAEAGATG